MSDVLFEFLFKVLCALFRIDLSCSHVIEERNIIYTHILLHCWMLVAVTKLMLENYIVCAALQTQRRVAIIPKWTP